MKLIADAGSSKVEWALIDADGVSERFETEGVNALMSNVKDMHRLFADALANHAADEIFFYGAGCLSPEVCAKVENALPAAGVKFVGSDLLGAARALFGHNAGLAAIMGTGSNCGLYNGERIVDNMSPLGYVLGDEGSGASIGCALLREIYRGDKSLRREFEQWLGMDYGEVLDAVYRKPRANAFLASLVPFIRDHRLEHIAAEAFARFFAATGSYFPSERRIAFVGGIAAAFEPELRKSARDYGFEITGIQKRPLAGLIKFHSNGN